MDSKLENSHTKRYIASIHEVYLTKVPKVQIYLTLKRLDTLPRNVCNNRNVPCTLSLYTGAKVLDR